MAPRTFPAAKTVFLLSLATLIFTGCGSSSSSPAPAAAAKPAAPATPPAEAPKDGTDQTPPAPVETCTPAASEVNLGTAAAYNLFLFGNLNQTGADIEGSAAVGGNAALTGASVGTKLGKDLSRVDLVVGGNLLDRGGKVENGAVVVAGKATLEKATLAAPPSKKGASIDFRSVQSQLLAESARLAKMPANGKVVTSKSVAGEMTLTGEAADLNVFDVEATQLAKIRTLKIEAPKNSRVLVNVQGPRALLKNLTMSLKGIGRSAVLINLAASERLDLAQSAIEGSILAPAADVLFSGGAVQGQVIARSLVGRGQVKQPAAEFCEGDDANLPIPPIPPKQGAPEVPYE